MCDPIIDQIHARLDALEATRPAQTAARFYPIGIPGTKWTHSERLTWRTTRALPLKRSYKDEVLQKIEAFAGRFDVEQYGALSYDPARYPLFAVSTKDWKSDLPTVLAEAYSKYFNIIVAPCVSPWGYEVINRWNPNADDPNRNFVPNSVAEECASLLRLLATLDSRPGQPLVLHIDLHETTDTDETEFRPAKSARDGEGFEPGTIPDGFYTVGDANNPQFEFQKAVIDSVRKVTHIAPPDSDGCIIGEPIQQEGVINYPAKGLGLCMGISDAPFVTTTEIYPDSPLVDDDNCNRGQVAAVVGALDFIKGQSSSATPHMTYFPIAGRAELIRLIAHVGGVEITENVDLPDGATKTECGSPSGLPVLHHGDLKMSQSTAIESYIASIAPKFAELTPQQRAKDAQFASIKEDVLAGFAKVLFGSKEPAELVAVADKWFPVIEEILPADGFINGLASPTPADLAILNICTGFMPFGAGYKIGSIDLGANFPKLKAHSDRTAAHPDVSGFPTTSAEANPMGI